MLRLRNNFLLPIIDPYLQCGAKSYSIVCGPLEMAIKGVEINRQDIQTVQNGATELHNK